MFNYFLHKIKLKTIGCIGKMQVELTLENFTQVPEMLCRDPHTMAIYENSKCTVDHGITTVRVLENNMALLMRGFAIITPPICRSNKFIIFTLPDGMSVKARIISVMKLRRTTLDVIGAGYPPDIFDHSDSRDDMVIVNIDTESVSNITMVGGQYTRLV